MEEKQAYYVYILENLTGNFYIGQTDDLNRRLYEHNHPETGTGKYTHKNGPWQLVYHEGYDFRSHAVKRERFIKSRKSSVWIRKYLLNR